MQTEFINLADVSDRKSEFAKAAGRLFAGGLVVFPTETVYGIACRVCKSGFARLDAVKTRPADKHYSLHLGDKSRLEFYVPFLSPRAKKLIRKALPGALTVVFDLSKEQLAEVKSRHSDEVFELLYKAGTIGIRCPSEPAAIEFLNSCDFPVVAPSANLSGRPPATDGCQAYEALNGLVDIVLDCGRCKYKQSSTVVRISGSGFDILRQGSISAAQIAEFTTLNIIFVCTGNTCRSPMAEGLAKKAIALKLKCDIDHLADFGYNIASAGTSAANGFPVSQSSVEYCKNRGVDISGHLSCALTADMVEAADYIFAASSSHIQQVLRINPAAADRVFLLDSDGEIADPFGSGFEVYNFCGRNIEQAVNKRIGEILQ